MRRRRSPTRRTWQPRPIDRRRPFVEHVQELRTRAFRVGAAVLLFATAAYFVQQSLVKLLLRPAHGQHFIYTSPGGGIGFLFKLCTDVGLILSLPVLVYELLGFLRPLLDHQARRFVIRAVASSALLGALGVAFGYFLGLPLALHFLSAQFTTSQITPLLTISEYMTFVTVYLAGSALLFQIPLVLIIINRIKPHTNFDAEIESGILKMMTIGACKHRGAVQAHRAAVDVSMGTMIVELGRYLVKRLPILFAVGLVENARHETAIVRAMRPERIEETERQLLKEAKALMAKIPFDFLHLLIVDEMGKEISGTGMDTNVIGRLYIAPEKEPETPRYVRILVRDLTEKTAGNAVGIGLADFATRRLADKINFKYTYTNSLTSGTVMRSKLPIILETDREAVEAALGTIGLAEPHEAKVARIKNTLELEEFQASEALLEAVRANPHLEVTGGPDPLAFGPAGDLLG